MLERTPLGVRLDGAAAEYRTLVEKVSAGGGSSPEFKAAVKRIGELEGIVRLKKEWEETATRLDEARVIAADETADGEFRTLAREEADRVSARRTAIEKEIGVLLDPPDPRDAGNAIVEIRAGTGGEEAALFARDLFRMYGRFAERAGFSIEIYDSHHSELGGLKEIVFFVKGKGAYGRFRFESGVHRVQRIPATEAAGRIHTSAATVAVLPEAKETDVRVEPKDLKVDTFCASGAGGQHVNKTASAVRITHLPTGIVVSCQDERSQMQNRVRAMTILLARLRDAVESEQRNRTADERKQQVGSGDRSEKIRTYNFPQNRLTDHRVNCTIHALDRIMDGELDGIVEACRRGLA